MSDLPRPVLIVDNDGRERIIESPASASLAAGGDGPHDPGMEARVAALEAAIKDVRDSLHRIEVAVAELRGRISQIPSGTQLVFMQAGMVLAIFAAAFALLKFAAPH